MKGSASVRWGFLLSAVLFFLFSLIGFRAGDISPNHQIWRGYYTLMVKEGASFQAEELLEGSELKFLSLSREKVDFFDYCGMRSVLLTDLDDTLEPQDPRIDPFMKKLPFFFSTRYKDANWEIFYIKSEKNLEKVSKELDEIFPEGSGSFWILADENLRPNPWLPLFFGLFFGLTAVLMGKAAPRIILYIIPWMGIFRSGNLPLFIASGLIILTVLILRSRILPLWKRHVDYALDFSEFREKLTFPSLLFAGGFVAGILWIISMGLGNKSVLFTLIGVLGLFCALALELIFEYMKVRRRDHRLFTPVFLLQKQRKGILSMDFIMPVVPALVLTAALILPVDVEEINAPVPSPVFFASENDLPGYDWQGVSLLEKSREGNRYPDLADYVSHEAYQEVFFYGGEYGFPQNGERLEQEIVQLHEEGIERDVIVLKEFTDQWYIDILSLGNKEGVVALLLNQKAPCRIETAGTIITGNRTDWKRAGSALFTLYFSALLLLFIIKGRRNIENRHKELESITFIREMEKEHIA